MIELPDDELDKLFRKSSEEFDPQYDPEDWNDLRKKLDQHDGRTGGAWFKKWWPLGLLLLLIPAGIVGYLWRENAMQNDGVVNEKVLQNNAEADFGKKQKVLEAAGSGNLTNTKSDKTEEAKSENANAPIVNEEPNSSKNGNATELKKDAGRLATTNLEKSFSKPLSRSELKAADVKSRPLLPRSRSKAGGVYLEPNRSKTGGGDGALILTENALTQGTGAELENAGIYNAIQNRRNAAGSGDLNADSQLNVAESENAGERILVSAAILKNRQPSWKNGTQQPAVIFETPEKTPAPEVKVEKEEVAQAKWAVRFGYSPDLSTVGGEKLTKPGTAVSLLAELSVLPRLFVQTGAVWSRKDYRANAGDYILNPKWGYYTKPESIEGICKVLEIPLNLRYDIISRSKSRIFAGSGLSSYYMRGEKYNYNYKNPYDPHIKYPGWQGKTGWYLFSHLNASAGYEYRISDKLSLVAEPYARMPLKRVGYGKVNLFTAGFWISVRYVPAFR